MATATKTEPTIITVHYPLGPQQKVLELLEGYDYVGMLGTRGSSKSDTIDAAIFQECLIIPGNKGAVFRRTQDSAGEDFDHFINYCPKEFIYKKGASGQSHYRFVMIKPYEWDGTEEACSTIIFLGVMQEGRQHPDKAKGEYGFIAFPELSEIEEGVFLQAITSCRKPGTRCKTVAAWNPVHDEHWIYKHFGKVIIVPNEDYHVCKDEQHRKDKLDCSCLICDADHSGAELRHVYAGQFPGYVTVVSTTLDNKHLPDDYVQKQFANRPAAWLNKWIHGKTAYDPDGRGVYEKDFRYDIHVATEELLPLDAPILRGYDPGLYPAIGWAQIVPVDGVEMLRILAEDTGFEVKYDEFLIDGSKKQSEQFFNWRDYKQCGDPSLRGTDARTLKSYMYYLEQAGISDVRMVDDPVRNSRSYRINILRNWLTITPEGKSRVIIDPRCTTLIEALEGGYKRKWNITQQKQLEEAVKDPIFSGIVDCVQYILINFTTIDGHLINVKGQRTTINAHQPSSSAYLNPIKRRTVIKARRWQT